MANDYLPYELQFILKNLEQALGASYSEAVAEVIRRWREAGASMSNQQARQIVVDVLSDWPQMTAIRFEQAMEHLFSISFLSGMASAEIGVQADRGDMLAVQWLRNRPGGFITAINDLSKDTIQKIEDVIGDAYEGVDENYNPAPFDLDDMIKRVKQRTEVGVKRASLIIRTETASITAMGRLSAWERDPRKDWYLYEWIAHHDERTKDVSLFFEAGNPYTFEQIKRRWTIDHFQPIRVVNRHTGKVENQVSAFNCRCTPARRPKSSAQMLEEGIITREQYLAETA